MSWYEKPPGTYENATECYPRRAHSGTGPTPEQRAAMRAAIAAGKQATKGRETR